MRPKIPANIKAAAFLTVLTLLSIFSGNGCDGNRPGKTASQGPGTFRGYVFDCFGYAAGGIAVKIVQSDSIVVQIVTTDSSGKYHVKGLKKDNLYKFRIEFVNNTLARNLDFALIDTANSMYRETLVVVPVSQVKITLCKDTGCLEPVDSTIPENPILKLSGLHVADARQNLRKLYCHMSISEAPAYLREKEIQAIFKWYRNTELQEPAAHLTAGSSEAGWYIVHAHPVSRGEWVVNIFTESGVVLGRQHFMIP